MPDGLAEIVHSLRLELLLQLALAGVLGGVIGLVPLPWSYFPWLFAILLCYCMLTQTVKTWYIRKFGTWL